jgi:transmembrane sensor
MRMTEAALGRGRLAPRPWFRRPAPVGAAILAGLATLGVGLYFTLGQPPTYATGPSEQRVVRLDDGSWVRLNVNSRIRVSFTPTERRLTLARGEAFFDVAHDTSRPFIVAADGTKVRAVGTKFDVRDRGDAIQVTLVEGRVRVQQDDRPSAWTLAPNQKLVVPDKGEPRRSTVDAAQTVSWTTGRLAFQDTPLAEAAAEVNRYGKAQIVVEGDELRRQPVTGYFDVGDTQSFVNGVSVLFDLQAQPAGSVITLRERPRAGG